MAEHSRIIDNELIPAFGRLAVKEVTKAEIISLLEQKGHKGWQANNGEPDTRTSP